MAQRRDPPPLEVRESFETTRFGPPCLIDAYTHLVPIRRKTVPRAGHDRPRPVVTPSRCGGKHG